MSESEFTYRSIYEGLWFRMPTRRTYVVRTVVPTRHMSVFRKHIPSQSRANFNRNLRLAVKTESVSSGVIVDKQLWSLDYLKGRWTMTATFSNTTGEKLRAYLKRFRWPGYVYDITIHETDPNETPKSSDAKPLLFDTVFDINTVTCAMARGYDTSVTNFTVGNSIVYLCFDDIPKVDDVVSRVRAAIVSALHTYNDDYPQIMFGTNAFVEDIDRYLNNEHLENISVRLDPDVD